MRLTMKTSLAMRVLMACTKQTGKLLRKREIAKSCHASEAHLALVIHQLGQEGFIETHRGRGGGFRLARDPATLTVGEVYRTMEPDHGVTDCLDRNHQNCVLADSCSLTRLLNDALAAFYDVLDEVTLKDLVNDNTGLRTRLDLAGE